MDLIESLLLGGPERGCYEIPAFSGPIGGFGSGPGGSTLARGTPGSKAGATFSPGAPGVNFGDVGAYLSAHGAVVQGAPAGVGTAPAGGGVSIAATTPAAAAILGVPLGTVITGGAAQYVITHFQVPKAGPAGPPAGATISPPAPGTQAIGTSVTPPAPPATSGRLPSPAQIGPPSIQRYQFGTHVFNVSGNPAQIASEEAAIRSIYAPSPAHVAPHPIQAVAVSPSVAQVPPQGAVQPKSARLITQPTGPALDLTAFSPAAIAAGQLPPVEHIPLAQSEPLPTVNAGALNPVLTKAISAIGLEQAGSAAINFLRGEHVSAPQFGALAGTIIGGIAGQPVYGAEVGGGIGTIVEQLDNYARQYYGSSLDNLLTGSAKSLYHSIVGQPTLVPTATTVQIASQPNQGITSSQPIPISAQPTGTAQTLPVPIGQQETLQNLTSGEHNPIPIGSQQGGQQTTQQLNPVNSQTGEYNCPPEIVSLVEQMSNCPPEVLNQLFTKFEINAQPGQKPQIVAKEEVCLCCESQGDFQAYMSSGGRAGSCVQVKPGQATVVE